MKSPCDDQKVKILHRSPEFEGTQHISLDIDVADDIGITDPAFIDASHRTQTLAIVDYDAEACRVRPEALHGFVR